jgi:hypothetical protein
MRNISAEPLTKVTLPRGTYFSNFAAWDPLRDAALGLKPTPLAVAFGEC